MNSYNKIHTTVNVNNLIIIITRETKKLVIPTCTVNGLLFVSQYTCSCNYYSLGLNGAYSHVFFWYGNSESWLMAAPMNLKVNLEFCWYVFFFFIYI